MFNASILHAVYTLDGVENEISIFRREITSNKIRIFVYLDDSVIGRVTVVKLIDKDGDIIAIAEREYEKPESLGFYTVFSYNFIEVEEAQNE